MKKYYAHLGETVQEHSFLTYNNSIKLSELNNTDEMEKDLCALSSIFHDIGKCEPLFQDSLNNSDIKVKYPHALISALYFYRYIHFIDKTKENDYHDTVAHSILFHHPIDKFDNTDLGQYCEEWGYKTNECISITTLSDMHTIADEFIEKYNSYCCEENKIYRVDIGGFERNKTVIKCFNNLMPFVTSSAVSQDNVQYIGICGNLKCADVLAAAHISDITSYFKLSNGNKFTIYDFVCPNDWDQDKFNLQKEYAVEILDNYKNTNKTFFEINEPVGFGKTAIYAIASLLLNKKIVIVSPTNTIAKNSYHSFCDFLHNFGLENKVSIGLLLTNKWYEFNEHNEEVVKKFQNKEERLKERQNDIIITNIDNYMRPLFKSDEKKYMAFDLSYRTVIFDEYHNYFSKSALMNSFNTVCRTRALFGNPLTILASATREPELTKILKGPNDEDKLYTLKKSCFNCERKIQITKRKIDYKIDNENMLVVCNSVKEAQDQALSFSKLNPNKQYLIYHAQHTKNDRIIKEAKLISTHGKNSQDCSLCVFATNIATTGLDISFHKVIITQMPINEMYQSMGRCNRFNEYKTGEVIVDYSLTEKKNNSEYAAIRTRYDTKLCDYELKLFNDHFSDGTYTIPQIDNIFSKIISNENYLNEKHKYFMELRRESGIMFGQLNFSYSPSNSNDNNVEYLANTINLRSKNNKEEEIELFIWCQGMKEDEYVTESFIKNKTIGQKAFGQREVTSMLNYLNKNKELQDKYFPNGKFKKEYNELKNNPNKWFSMIEKIIKLGKCSNTPFISFNHEYDTRRGLRVL